MSLTEARTREHHRVRIIEADHHPASPDAVIETMVKARVDDEEPRIRPAEAVTPVESVEVVVVMPEPVVVMGFETVVMMSEAHVAAAVVEASEVTAAAPAGQRHGIAGVVAGPGWPGSCLAPAEAGEEQDQKFEDAHGEPSTLNSPGTCPRITHHSFRRVAPEAGRRTGVALESFLWGRIHSLRVAQPQKVTAWIRLGLMRR